MEPADQVTEEGFRPPHAAGFQPARYSVCALESFRFCADQAE